MSLTIKDIVKDTGLSLATVSKYLNNKKISEKNCHTIEESIKKLGYIPNRTAQGLRSKTSHCICIFMPDIHDYHFGYECNSIVEYMKAHGYSSIVRTYGQTPGDSSNDILFLENRQIDGVVLFTYSKYPFGLLSQLAARRIPYVCMHQKPDRPSDFVGGSDEPAGYRAAEFLYRHGHRHAALIGLDSYSGTHKIKGFLDFLLEHGGNRQQPDIRLCPSKEAIPDSYFESLSLLSRPPTAVLSLDHTTTMRLLGSFTDYSASAPDYISFMGFDDDEIFSAITPSLTVFSRDIKNLGQQAAALLLKRMQGSLDGFPETHLIAPMLIERESVV